MNRQKSFEQEGVGTLYLVPTPIGNLEDMTLRAARLLGEVSLIAAEDTRHTQKLLNHLGLKTPQISFHEHNAQERIPHLLDLLQQGQDLAQVSDAGMPSISDPGHDLVKACLAQGLPVVALPGANAALTALIASGLAPQPFTFFGFLPRKKQEQLAFLKEVQDRKETLIFYESPFRVKKTLAAMQEVFSPHRQVVLCRELTKRYEEYIRGSLQEVLIYLEERELKGECCLLIQGALPDEQAVQESETIPSGLSLAELVDWYSTTYQLSNKEAIKRVAKETGQSKQAVYKAYHE